MWMDRSEDWDNPKDICPQDATQSFHWSCSCVTRFCAPHSHHTSLAVSYPTRLAYCDVHDQDMFLVKTGGLT